MVNKCPCAFLVFADIVEGMGAFWKDIFLYECKQKMITTKLIEGESYESAYCV